MKTIQTIVAWPLILALILPAPACDRCSQELAEGNGTASFSGSQSLRSGIEEKVEASLKETIRSTGLEEVGVKVILPSFWKDRGIQRQMKGLLGSFQSHEIPSDLRFLIELILLEVLKDVQEHGYRYQKGFRTLMTSGRLSNPDRFVVSIQDQVAQYQRSQGRIPAQFRFSQMPPPPTEAEAWTGIVEEHLRVSGREGGIGTRIIRAYLDAGRFSLEESFNPEVGNRYVFTFPIHPAAAELEEKRPLSDRRDRLNLKPSPEALRRFDRKDFLMAYPAQANQLPKEATGVSLVKKESPIQIWFYHFPDTLDSAVERLIRSEETQLPAHFLFRVMPLPSSAEDITRHPAAIIQDPWEALPYEPPLPVIPYLPQPDEDLLWQLEDWVAIALWGDKARPIHLLKTWEFEEEGASFLAFAVEA